MPRAEHTKPSEQSWKTAQRKDEHDFLTQKIIHNNLSRLSEYITCRYVFTSCTHEHIVIIDRNVGGRGTGDNHLDSNVGTTNYGASFVSVELLLDII